MAIMYPNRAYKCSQNEKVLFTLLMNKVPNDYNVWFKKSINEEPTIFTMLCPNMNIIKFKIYEWDMKDFVTIDTDQIHLKYKRDNIDFEKIYDFEMEIDSEKQFTKNIADRIVKNTYYKHLSDSLKVYSVNVFPKIQEVDFNDIRIGKNLLNQIFDRELTILKEDIDKLIMSNDISTFINEIGSEKLFRTAFKSEDEIDYMRYCMDPILEVNRITESISEYLDIEQEQIIKFDPDVNLLIQGSAGTGKTTLLRKRVEYLAKHNEKVRILVVSYSESCQRVLKDGLLEGIEEYGMIKFVDIADLKEEFHNKSYDYILVDEGQDFSENHYTKMLKLMKDDGHIWITSSGSENIFNNEHLFNTLGFEIDESIILKKNYRNSKEIVEFAEGFLYESDSIPAKFNDNIFHSSYLVPVEKVIKQWKTPEVHFMKEMENQISYLSKWITKLYESGENYTDIAVLTFNNETVDQVLRYLKANGIPGSNSSKEGVYVGRIDSVKGLEFSSVTIMNFGKSEDFSSKKLVYLGLMTAKLNLLVLTNIKTLLTDALNSEYQRILLGNGRKLEFDISNSRRMLLSEIDKILLREQALDRLKKIIDKSKSEMAQEREDLTNREMRAIVSEGPKEIEVLKKSIETKDLKITKLTNELDKLKSEKKKETKKNSKKNLSKFMNYLYFEKDRILSITKWLVTIVLLLVVFLNFSTINNKLDLKNRIDGFFNEINSMLEGTEEGIEENEVVSELDLKVIGNEEFKESLIMFEFDNSADKEKLFNGLYQDGFTMNFAKKGGNIEVKLIGAYKLDEKSENINVDKVLVLDSQEVKILINNNVTFKETEEGTIPIEFLWEQDENGLYNIVFK